MKSSTKRILVIADVIAQINAARLAPCHGTFIMPRTMYSMVDQCPVPVSGPYQDNQQVQKNVQEMECCEACAKGSLFISYIRLFDSVTSRQVRDANIQLGFCPTTLDDVFPTELLSEIEAAFEGTWYTGADKQTTENINKVLDWRRKTLETIPGAEAQYRHQKLDVSCQLLIAIMKQLLENDGKRLIL